MEAPVLVGTKVRKKQGEGEEGKRRSEEMLLKIVAEMVVQDRLQA